ncbi:MAG: hypothetical protein INF72_16690 [Roseomonas sp.]|nr:hypothetical protein [Roseomonas sp.]MCA3354194.1 hypothetical protein [Roseomonas sp.]
MDNLKPEPLNAEARAIFRRLLGIMIPADPEMALPSADDPLILEDCIETLGRDAAAIRILLAELMRLGFLDLPIEQAEAKAMALLSETRAEVQTLSRVVVAAYYRDGRVMQAYGREPRAPFPKGHALPQGDWTLLDSVKQKKAFWRDDRGA